MGIAYFFVRYLLSAAFCRWTVHRGMFHSIPAMLIAGLVVYLCYPSRDYALRLYLGGGVMLGFLSHLVLDELCSVDFMGVRVRFNKFAGSALKFGSPSYSATLFTYTLLGVLGFLAFQGVPGWLHLPNGWQRPAWLGQSRERLVHAP
jgi:hypothetical protein